MLSQFSYQTKYLVKDLAQTPICELGLAQSFFELLCHPASDEPPAMPVFTSSTCDSATFQKANPLMG